MEKLATKIFGPAVIICVPLFFFISIIGPHIGFSYPDEVHSFAFNIRGEGTYYFQPVIGILFCLIKFIGLFALAGLTITAIYRIFMSN